MHILSITQWNGLVSLIFLHLILHRF